MSRTAANLHMANAPLPIKAPVSSRHRQDVLYPRGILDAVIDCAAGRYVSFNKGDVGNVHGYWTEPSSIPADWKSGIAQSDGLLIIRHPFKRYDYDSAPALGPFWHDYGPLQPYIRWAKDPPPYLGDAARKSYRNPPKARGIDVHPDAKRLIQKRHPTPAIFFCLEGCLKADSVLSAGHAACSVLGVTMWNDEEHLRRIAPALRYEGRPVFVVTDSDWRTNPDVAREGVKCVRALRTRNVDAWHVAPPSLPTMDKTGVDDFLASGRSILELEVAPLPPLTAFPLVAPDARSQALLEYLRSKDALCIRFRPAKVADDMDTSKWVLSEALRALERARLVTVKRGRPLQLQPGEWGNEPHKVLLEEALVGPCRPLDTWFDENGLKGYKRGRANGPGAVTPLVQPPNHCQACQEPFTPKRHGHVFCGSRCRSQNQRRAARAAQSEAP
jgi:predicted nucleic acid-binding Zn ribbon protein